MLSWPGVKRFLFFFLFFFLLASSVTTSALAAPPSNPLSPPSSPASHVKDERAPVEWQIGRGKPTTTVVFMHGLGGSPEGYGPLVRDLLGKRGLAATGAVRVVAPYMRPEDGPHTMSDQLERARAVIDREPGPVILMGHSFGGKAALKLAQEYPQAKVPAVVALAPSVNMLHAYWKRMTGESGLPSRDVVEARLAQAEAGMVHELGKLPAGDDSEHAHYLKSEIQQVRFMRDLAVNDERGTESSVKTPTLVFHGTDDSAVSVHYAQRFAAANAPSVKLVVLPNVGHGLDASPPVKRDMAQKIATFVGAQTAKR